MYIAAPSLCLTNRDIRNLLVLFAAINLAACHKNRFIFLGAGTRVELSECSLFARVVGILGVEKGTGAERPADGTDGGR